MDIKITYMSGAGNLFTVIDNRDYKFSKETLKKLSPILCSLKFSTEGLLALNKSDAYDFDADFYNPDGSSGVMCGNGGRCSVLFAGQYNFLENLDKPLIKFSMAGDVYKAKLENEKVSLYMPPPNKIAQKIKIEEDFFTGLTDYINVNSDHIVFNYNDLNINEDFFEFDLVSFAKPLRYLAKVFPNGTNVNVYFIDSEKNIHLRTYERGVEAETGACGTGATSTAISIALGGLFKFPIDIIPNSRKTLRIDCVGSFPDNIENMILQGSAEIIGYDLIDVNIEDL
ncbi:MAG: diaminopimelate epimerase [Candidatus Kapabacteria bacterium]|nr:diaminopimelate epimerase [Candidatus Kapabacteria bacterium]